MLTNGIIVDGVKWIIGERPRRPIPLCPKDFIKLSLIQEDNFIMSVFALKCEECNKVFKLPREFDDEKEYVLNKIDAKVYKNMKFINLDDEALPLSEDKKSSRDNKFFVTSLLTQSKLGLRLVVYAGKKGSNQKTQIFVEPDVKRLAFDQNNLHPTDVFTKLEATFSDGTKATQEKKK